MAQQETIKGTSARIDLRRILIAVAFGLPLLWLSIAVTLSGIYARRNPDVVLAWWPWSADAAAAKSSQLVLSNSDARGLAEASQLAAAALDRQPVNPIAARSLALSWSLRGQRSAQADRLLKYSETLSRHDGPTQLWLIESHVQRGDIIGALVHYDRALRAEPNLREQLIPVLTSAADDPAIARPLATFLARNPSWRYDFIAAYLPKAENPVTLGILLPAFLLDPRSGVDRPYLGVAISKMVALGQPAMALRFYRQIAPTAAGRERVNNSDFARDPGPPPFDWSFNAHDELIASREPAENGGSHLRVSVPASADEWVARQTVQLDPGTYRLGVSVANDAANGSVLTARLTCAGGAAFVSQPEKNGRIATDIVVPASGCDTALLSLDVRGGLDGPPSDYMISRVSLIRR